MPTNPLALGTLRTCQISRQALGVVPPALFRQSAVKYYFRFLPDALQQDVRRTLTTEVESATGQPGEAILHRLDFIQPDRQEEYASIAYRKLTASGKASRDNVITLLRFLPPHVRTHALAELRGRTLSEKKGLKRDIAILPWVSSPVRQEILGVVRRATAALPRLRGRDIATVRRDGGRTAARLDDLLHYYKNATAEELQEFLDDLSLDGVAILRLHATEHASVCAALGLVHDQNRVLVGGWCLPPPGFEPPDGGVRTSPRAEALGGQPPLIVAPVPAQGFRPGLRTAAAPRLPKQPVDRF